MSEKLYSISNPIHKQTIENQECRMNLDGVKPVEGYMVSFRSKEHKINVLDFNVGHVDSFIRSNLDLLHNRNCFVGTWIDNDIAVSYTHLRAHETGRNLVCRLLLEKK